MGGLREKCQNDVSCGKDLAKMNGLFQIKNKWRDEDMELPRVLHK